MFVVEEWSGLIYSLSVYFSCCVEKTVQYGMGHDWKPKD